MSETESPAQNAHERALAVKARHEADLMAKANVVGVGVGLRHVGGRPTDEICVVVMVRKKVPRRQLDPADVIPGQIDGVPVDIQEVGDLRAQG